MSKQWYNFKGEKVEPPPQTKESTFSVEDRARLLDDTDFWLHLHLEDGSVVEIHLNP